MADRDENLSDSYNCMMFLENDDATSFSCKIEDILLNIKDILSEADIIRYGITNSLDSSAVFHRVVW